MSTHALLISIIALISLQFIIICLGGMIWMRLRTITSNLGRQHNLILRIGVMLKNKSATNAVAENAEMIYQDLLQNLIPVMAAIDVMPRNTPEHPLWRALGGILDEYSRDPFVLEKLRRSIKLNAEVARNIHNYINRANAFLNHLSSTDSGSILTTTFTDGLLGQSLTFFAQAVQLAGE